MTEQKEPANENPKHGIVAGILTVRAQNEIHARDMVLYGLPFDVDVVSTLELEPGEFEVKFLSGDEE